MQRGPGAPEEECEQDVRGTGGRRRADNQPDQLHHFAWSQVGFEGFPVSSPSKSQANKTSLEPLP